MRKAGYPARARPRRRAGAAVLAEASLSVGVLLASAGPPAAAATIRPDAPAARAELPGYVPLWGVLQAQGGVATADLGPARATAAVGARVHLAGRTEDDVIRYRSCSASPPRPCSPSAPTWA